MTQNDRNLIFFLPLRGPKHDASSKDHFAAVQRTPDLADRAGATGQGRHEDLTAASGTGRERAVAEKPAGRLEKTQTSTASAIFVD